MLLTEFFKFKKQNSQLSRIKFSTFLSYAIFLKLFIFFAFPIASVKIGRTSISQGTIQIHVIDKRTNHSITLSSWIFSFFCRLTTLYRIRQVYTKPPVTPIEVFCPMFALRHTTGSPVASQTHTHMSKWLILSKLQDFLTNYNHYTVTIFCDFFVGFL